MVETLKCGQCIVTTWQASLPDSMAGQYPSRPLPPAFLAPEPDREGSFHVRYTHDMPASPVRRAGGPCAKSAACNQYRSGLNPGMHTCLKAGRSGHSTVHNNVNAQHAGDIHECRQGAHARVDRTRMSIAVSSLARLLPVHAWQRLHVFAVTNHAVHLSLQLH